MTAAASETAVITVQGMNCDHCVQTVHKALSSTPGVQQASVDLPRGQARVVYDPAAISIARLMQVINATGFTAAGFTRNPAAG